MNAPRIGFLGCGATGRSRMEAMLNAGEIETAAICDPDLRNIRETLRIAPDAVLVPDLKEMLQLGLDGVAIATPGALHAEQAITALEGGCAVFCQKPVGRTAAEARSVVEAARAADRLLGVDLSYRFTEGLQRIREYAAGGEIGDIFAADLTFHDARGPSKDGLGQSGGCVADLGAHLLDLALWIMGFPAVEAVEAHLFAQGRPLAPGDDEAEDFAVATLVLEGGGVARIACSWNLAAGREAVIETLFHGTRGGAAMRNVSGSFTDLRAELYRGTSTETLSSPGDAWSGRAAARWAAALAGGDRFDPEAERLVTVAQVIDRIYGRA